MSEDGNEDESEEDGQPSAETTGERPEDSAPSDQPTIPTTGDTEKDDTEKRDNRLDALGDREGWRVEGSAARVHYSGATDRYSIEFYAPSDCLLYWKVPPEESRKETAVPVGRSTVPTPLRERIRADLAAANVDPELERRTL